MESTEIITSRYGETTIPEFVARYDADPEAVGGEGASLAGEYMVLEDGSQLPLTDTEKWMLMS